MESIASYRVYLGLATLGVICFAVIGLVATSSFQTVDALANDALPKPPKVGTVYRFYGTEEGPDVGLEYWMNPSRGAPPMSVTEISMIWTVTAVGADTHAITAEHYRNKRLMQKFVAVVPNNPFLQEIKSEAVPVEGKAPMILRTTATEKPNINMTRLFPLSVGKKWSIDRSETVVDGDTPDVKVYDPGKPKRRESRRECVVNSRETITVGAGTFPTYAIVCRISAPGVPSAGPVTRNYSPDLGIFIRSEQITPMSPAPYKTRLELTSVTVPTE
jgi:hypothetical protein